MGKPKKHNSLKASTGVAFVVDINAAAARDQGAVVHHRAKLAGDLLPDSVRIVAGLLAVEVGLESMANGFVQEDTAVSRC